MKRLLLVVLTIAIVAGTVHAQGTPFKLGTFERQGRPFVGIVLRDSVVIYFAAANTAMAPAKVTSPTDMKDLIERYNNGVRDRIDLLGRRRCPGGWRARFGARVGAACAAR